MMNAIPKFIDKLLDSVLFGESQKELLDHFTVHLLFGNWPLHSFEAVFRAVKAFSKAVVANMDKNKGISMKTLAKICDTLRFDITYVIELADMVSKKQK